MAEEGGKKGEVSIARSS